MNVEKKATISPGARLVTTYVLFAGVATAANIGAQELVVRLYSGSADVLLSVVFGTAIGLVTKYLLDKKYIFQYKTNNSLHNGTTFLLYSLMGVVTTIIFWCFEFGFNHLFESKEMRYLGGIIGLSIGYVTKYQLDKAFVFREPQIATDNTHSDSPVA